MRSNPSPVENLFGSALESLLPPGFEIFRRASDEFQRSAISLGALEAGILSLFVSLHRGEKWVEVGTLTGFSAFCIANRLPPNGHVWTCEKDPTYAAKARELFKMSGFEGKITVVEGDAEQTLAGLSARGPFDGIFIDGNKASYPMYLDWAESNLKKGALIVADNVFLGGAVWEGPSDKSNWNASTIQKMKDFSNRLLNSENYEAALIPTSEGLLVAKKKF
jgi:predicted O-methyltransferase YrrM